jgi:hypothetical protein
MLDLHCGYGSDRAVDDLNTKSGKRAARLIPCFSRLRVPMGKYCYGKGRRKVIEEFTNWQGLWVLAVLSAVATGTLLLYMLGYLHLDGD